MGQDRSALASKTIALLMAGTLAVAAGPARGEGPSLAQLALDADQDVHVYLRGPDGARLAGICTGKCELHLTPGTYSVAAGFQHSRLSVAPASLLLGPGDQVNLHVDVQLNPKGQAALGGSLLLVLGGTVALTAAFAREGFSQDRMPKSGLAVAGLVAIGVGLVAGYLSVPAAEQPVVTARRWEVPVKEDAR